ARAGPPGRSAGSSTSRWCGRCLPVLLERAPHLAVPLGVVSAAELVPRLRSMDQHQVDVIGLFADEGGVGGGGVNSSFRFLTPSSGNMLRQLGRMDVPPARHGEQ